MSILITGGTGFIGSHTVVEFLQAGEDVVIVDNFSNSKPCVLDRIEAITGKRPKFYEVDLLDRAALTKVFEENTIESCIHFAGLKAVGESCAQPLRYYHNNITGTLILCELLHQYGARKLVFSSSATVYGKPESVPIREDFPLSTTNPYGETKLEIERILKDLTIAEPDWSVTVLRYFNPIGAHKSGTIGEDPKGIPNNLFPYIAKVAAGKLTRLQVFGNDYDTKDGTGVRDYIHVVDLAQAHLKALARTRKTTGIDYINVGTGVGYSVLEMIAAYEKVTGLSVPYDIVARRPGDIDECYADPAKAARVLGWQAQYGLEDMCRDAARWQAQNPDGYPD